MQHKKSDMMKAIVIALFCAGCQAVLADDLARRLSAAKYAFESGADVRNLISLELMP